jgi:hypothetical protein
MFVYLVSDFPDDVLATLTQPASPSFGRDCSQVLKSICVASCDGDGYNEAVNKLRKSIDK